MGIFALYVIVMFFVALYLARKTDRKFLGLVLMFWILAQPVLHSKFTIDIPGLPFDFQPNRILLIILFGYLVSMKLLGVKTTQNHYGYVKPPPFEKYFFAYLVIMILSLAYNYANIKARSLVVEPSAILTFILSYYVAKYYMTKSLFDAIIKAIILLSIVSAFIAIIQIGINGEFFKTGDPRIAFGSVVRSTGIFRSEYELGHFQILAIFVVITTMRKSFRRQLLVALLVFTVLLTFHRLDLLIMLTGFIIYNWIFGRASSRVMFTSAVVLVVLMGGAMFSVLQSSIRNTDFAKERLSDTTIKGRFHQYEVILKEMPKYALFGMGGYESEIYADLMIKNNHAYSANAGTTKWYKVPYEVHNGYLAVGAYHGLIALSLFVAIMLLMLLYFKRRLSREKPITFVPFIIVLVWMLSNLSNGLSSFSTYNVLLLAILTGAFVSLFNNKNDDIEVSSDDEPEADINKRVLRLKRS